MIEKYLFLYSKATGSSSKDRSMSSSPIKRQINALIQKNKEMEVQMKKFEDIIYDLRWDELTHRIAINDLLKAVGKQELASE